MRKIILTLVLFGATLGGLAATPTKADAAWWRSRYAGYYPNYSYAPAYSYYALRTRRRITPPTTTPPPRPATTTHR